MNELVCPNCGCRISLSAKVEKADVMADEDVKNDVLAYLGLQKADIRIEGNFAFVTLKGKFNKKRFGRIRSNVVGLSGEYVKGYFKVPIAGLILEK